MIYSDLTSFGYPVINPFGDDFLDKNFTSTVEVEVGPDNNGDDELKTKISHKVPDFFKKLLIDKKVTFLTVLRCNFTSFETHKVYFETDKDLSFRAQDCFGKISIDSYIICNEILEIGKEINKKYVNKYYHSLKKPYEKNSLIGFSKPSQYSLEENINAEVSSIFRPYPSEHVTKGCLQYNFSDDLIEILYHKDDEKLYLNIQQNSGEKQKAHKDIFINTVLIPALSVALLVYKEQQDEHGDNSLKWKSALYSKLHELNIKLADIQPEAVNELANKLIYLDADKGITQLFESIRVLGSSK